ncbi:short chain dehydrogenase [Rhodococcus jostii RHA1] [Mycobacterium shimoidei]|uniref:Short chain dehydrogenase [Rhodococcus jostii RHA1] n=1 Tax=Mycobacterium shimoidei TaxID=29313 RepID=A0A375YUZ2_MYCSH|nr:SDR family NAD(P)-dependent oxidoreductase [Mycobacterium shimoidei]SRX92686.1 short chain dehydrogenase [Rhodococcus jostii RHA1] [Mycobacterium shimoidei]
MTQFRTATITDASSPVALATAARLARRGDLVLMGSRDVDVCERFAMRLRAAGAAAFAAHLDLADSASIDRFVESAHYLIGDADVLVTGAGVANGCWFGAQHLAAQLIPPMIQAGRGDVVLISPELLGATPQTADREFERWLSGLEAEFVGTGVRASIVRSAGGDGPVVPGDVGRIVAAMTGSPERMRLRVVEVCPPARSPLGRFTYMS